MQSKLLIFPDPLDASCSLSMDNGLTFYGQPDTHSGGRQGQSFIIPDGTPNGWGAQLKIVKDGKVPIDQKGILNIADATATLQMDDFRLQDASAAIPPPTNGGGVVGCHDGRLADPVAWFFHRIKRQIGMPANDWHTVLSNCGITAGGGPGELIPIPDPAGTYGIRLQIGSEGPRGRWFAPSTTPDDLGYYTCEYQAITDDPNVEGGLVWAHIVFKSGTYFAHPCPNPVTAQADTRTAKDWAPLGRP